MPRTLLLLAAALAACGGAPDDPATLADIAVPEPDVVTGTLEAGDETLQSGEYADVHEVVARAGQFIRAEVVSGDFDPYLLVLDPTGEQTDVDDSTRGNTTMTEAILPVSEGGEWTVVVTTYEPGETGGYELSLEVLDELPEGEETTPPNMTGAD